MLTLNAYAKINLTLEVQGRGDDGYHDIVSILQTISLHDTIILEHADDIELVCDIPELQSSDNLAVRAARLLKDKTGHAGGVGIGLKKGIPFPAGLGGGSSDAAVVLKGLNELWKLGMSIDDLTPLAAQLGSDVPFFLHGGTAMVQGSGERVRPLPPSDLDWIVLLVPRINVPNKTASVYSHITPSNYTAGMLTRKLEARIRGGGDVPPQFLFNVFDDVAFDAFPGLKEYWDAFRSLGAREIHLCGSGPSMFAPVSRRELGTAIQLLLQSKHGWQSHLVQTWHPSKGEAQA
jgi:4-diphosphocytidyl-2-C-methyl-D-erythritol kinase